MEALFRELVETNKEILNEIRLLRKEFLAWQTRSAQPDQSHAQNQALAHDAPQAAGSADHYQPAAQPPAQDQARPQAPWLDESVRPVTTRPLPASKSTSLPDPADFGLTETAKSPPPRYSSQDLEDLRGALLDGVKQRNKQKRDAFAEFEKIHKR